MNWIQTVEADVVMESGRKVVRHQEKQIVIFYHQEQFFAVDNRCPHEGYPLKEGTLDKETCVLTCQWHNWKFDIKTGKSFGRGEDTVRTYPVRIVDGVLELDVTEPDPESIREGTMIGLREAVTKHQYGRIVREVARLESVGLDSRPALAEVIHKTADRFEYGATHALGATADWLKLYGRKNHDVHWRVTAIAESLDHYAYDTLRQEPFPYTKETKTFESQAFLDAVETENEQAAIAMIRGAIQAGLTWSDLQETFAMAALSHYYDFGHMLIWVTKVQTLVDQLGQDILLPTLLPFTRRLCMATREDMVPEFRAYEGILSDKPTSHGTALLPPEENGPQEMGIREALKWTQQAYATYTPQSVYKALIAQLARNMLYYNTSYDHATDLAVKHNVGWLDFTHGITMANAARKVCEQYPQLWYPALLQLAMFAGRNKPYVDLNQDISSFRRDKSQEDYFEDMLTRVGDHGLVHPIYSCHQLKTTLAAEAESQYTPEAYPLLQAALQRYFDTPIREKHVRRTVNQALALVSR